MNQTNHRAKVLLVEDDTFLVGMYVSMLEHEYFVPIVANDGERGLEMARRERPDVILLDIMLPKMDGFFVLEELKRDPVTRDIPVILLSNLGQEKDVERGAQLGAAEYLIKAHYMPTEVMAHIKKLLQDRASVRRLST